MRMPASAADCMASSAQNSYKAAAGQPAPPNANQEGQPLYYGADFSSGGQSLQQRQSLGLSGREPLELSKSAHHSASSSMVAYEPAAYSLLAGGMLSDSELTTSSTAARHHHRPYSSQSRVYHAHPVPRQTQQQQQPARLYSASSASSAQSSPGSSVYLPPAPSNESPLSPVVQQQPAPTGRQLPQRPIKQSMSIDQQYQQQQQQQQHQQQQQQQQPVNFHHSPAHQTKQLYAAPLAASRYEPQLDLAGRLSLYEHAGELSAELPPVGPARSASSSSAQMSGRQHAGQQHLMGSISLEQRHHHDPFQQTMLQQPSQEAAAYARQLQLEHYNHADWLASPRSQPALPSQQQQQQHGRHIGGQFKQTMSIDHYQATGARHYSPARQAAHFAAGDPQFHPLAGTYTANSPVARQQHQVYESSPSLLANQQASYYAQQAATVAGKYGGYRLSQQHLDEQSAAPMGQHEHNIKHFDRANTMGANVRPKLQHQQSSSSSNSNLSGSLKSAPFDVANYPQQEAVSAKQTKSDHHQKSITSASSAPVSHHYHSPQQQQQQSLSKQHYSGKPPAGQHHREASGANRQEAGLRRGFTSVSSSGANYATASSANELGGSQGALSELADLSLSHASYSGQANKRTVNMMRATSPSLGFEPGQTASGSHQHHHSSSSSHAGAAGSGSREASGDAGASIRSESSTGLPNGATGGASSSNLTKKSNSATQLSMTGTKKRLGFRKKQVTSFSVHRSEEVAPLEARHLVKQGSSVSEGDSSMSGDSSSRSWSNSNFKQQASDELASMSFIDGLGKGQMISRQGLTSPYLGDVQLSLCDRRGNLEIEVIRARNLQAKTSKIEPLTYVKLYLVKNRKCLGKAKTTLSNKRTLNPLFQQQLTFHEDYHGCILQSIVWGNFGKMDKKNFMGIAQISIDDLELSDTVISWYKLFLPSSLQTLPSKSLRHTLLSNSTESFTNTNNS